MNLYGTNFFLVTLGIVHCLVPTKLAVSAEMFVEDLEHTKGRGLRGPTKGVNPLELEDVHPSHRELQSSDDVLFFSQRRCLPGCRW